MWDPQFCGQWAKWREVKFYGPKLRDGAFLTSKNRLSHFRHWYLQYFLVSFYNDEGSLTSIFWALGLREGNPTCKGSKTERWEIHKYQKWIVTVLAKNSIASNILVTCHNARDERNSYLLGFWAEGRQPTCKAEDRRSTSRKLDSYTFGQWHYLADMSQYWGMSDPHFLGLWVDWSLRLGVRYWKPEN